MHKNKKKITIVNFFSLDACSGPMCPPYKVSPFAYPFICLNLSISHQLSKCPSYQLQLNFWIAQYPDIPIEFDNSINLDPLYLIPQTTAVCTL